MTAADEDNAYRSPQANILPQMQPPPVPEGAWRDGSYLVVHKSFRDYPERCIVCNAPQAAKARISVRWIRAPIVLIIVGLVLSPPLALVIWMALPTATVWPKICDDHHRREAWGRRSPWFLALLGVLLLVVSLTFVAYSQKLDLPFDGLLIGAPLFAIGVIVIWGAVAYGIMRPRLLTAIKIDRQFIWLDKVSPEYVRQFPELGAP